MTTAEKIANCLFTNAFGEKAKRLILELEDGKDGGGLNLTAVISAIDQHLASRQVSKLRKNKPDVPKPAGPIGSSPPDHTTHARIAKREKHKVPFSIVMVYAEDWNRLSYQKDLNETFETCQAWVSGMLVNETNETIALAQDYFSDIDQVRDIMVIPKCTIKFRKTILRKGARL